MQKIDRLIESIVSLPELEERLKSGKPMRIKYGVDVTAPFLHLGHAVNLWMMRAFQECGHKVVFLIGDFTTQIGDPTGKSETRKQISKSDIEKNAKEFIRQVGRVLLTDERVFEIRRNSEWYDKMPLSEFLSLGSMVTHARLIQRDMFQKRIEMQKEIFIHEMLYPILQGYDSVMLDSDLTIVGSDQLFNEMMGRFYQERFQQKPQVIITSRITPGTDGKEKQSKSLGNYIALDDTARDQFGKVMSLSDSLILPYFEVYTPLSNGEIAQKRKALEEEGANPMQLKKELAVEIVSRYHGRTIAEEERSWFENTFSKREVPEDALIPLSIRSGKDLIGALQAHMPDQSKSALLRVVEGGGLRVNGEKMTKEALPDWEPKDGDLLKFGKRHWFKVTLP